MDGSCQRNSRKRGIQGPAVENEGPLSRAGHSARSQLPMGSFQTERLGRKEVPIVQCEKPGVMVNCRGCDQTFCQRTSALTGRIEELSTNFCHETLQRDRSAFDQLPRRSLACLTTLRTTSDFGIPLFYSF